MKLVILKTTIKILLRPFFLILLPAITFAIGYEKNTISDEDLAVFEGQIIDSIYIENRNIYNTKEKEYDNFIFKTANRLHIVTRKSVIGRELLFKVGDPFSADLAEEIGRNLRTHYVLFDAWVIPERLPDGRLLVRVVTIDQWSLLGGFNIKREGNENIYKIGFEERNFLGFNQFLSMDYYVQDKDDNFFRTVFSDERLYGSNYFFKLEYSDNPLDEVQRILLTRPYYNLNQKITYGFSYNNRGSRRDIYIDNVQVARSFNSGDAFSTYFGYRWGEYKQKIGFNLTYNYQYEKTYDTAIYFEGAPVVFPEDSVYHEFTLTIPIENLNFVKLKRINGFRYTEDITLGQQLSLTFGRAFRPDFKDNVFDLATFDISAAFYYPGNLILAGYNRSIWYKDRGNIRKYSSFSLRYYNNRINFLTFAFRTLYLSDWRWDGTESIAIGGVNALRGYNKFYRTGDRAHIINVEGRFFPNIEFMSVIFGGAVFADFGRTWKPDEPMTVSDYLWSVGAGLRISFEKTTKSRLVRFDLSFREDGQWELSVDTGQYF